MRPLAIVLVMLALAVPAAAGDGAAPGAPVAADDAPKLSLRPFFVVTGQEFAAKRTFDGIFGSAFQPFYGGGAEFSMRNGLFVAVTASRFSKTGQRAFFFNNQSYGLGIPLTATVTPVELSAGFRFMRVWRTIIPYAGAGYASYGYKETSQFSDPSENIDTRHGGYLVLGGAEFRLHRWVGVSADAQYTHLTGILGAGGVSKEASEKNLGGVAIRARVIVGR